MVRDLSTSRAVPLWARLLDALCVLLVALALVVAISGGFRQSIGAIRFSVTSPLPLLLWAVGFAIARHLGAPQHAVYREFPAAADRWLRRSEIRAAATAVVATRVPILLVGCFAVYTFGYPSADVPLRLFDNELLNLPVRWDAGWYLQIVTDGYRYASNAPDTQQNIVFLPAYPLLVRLVGRLFGGHATGYVAAGMAVSLASFFAALLYLYALARDFVDDERARYALWLIASYPFAVFFGAIYTESLFLLAALAAFYHMTKGQFGRAMAWGLLVGLTKPNGAALSIPLAMLAISSRPRPADAPAIRRFDPAVESPTLSTTAGRVARAIVAAAMPGVGLLLFAIFVWRLTGDPLAWARGQAAWGRTYEPITQAVGRQYSYIAHGGLNAYMAVGGYDVLNMLAAVFALAAVWPVARRLGAPYAALILVVIVPPIATGGWLSVGRFSSVLFPIFVWLAASIPESRRNAWIVGFTAFQALNAALFFTWRPLI
jgi:mannosyltransferase PIG-V